MSGQSIEAKIFKLCKVAQGKKYDIYFSRGSRTFCLLESLSLKYGSHILTSYRKYIFKFLNIIQQVKNPLTTLRKSQLRRRLCAGGMTVFSDIFLQEFSWNQVSKSFLRALFMRGKKNCQTVKIKVWEVLRHKTQQKTVISIIF